MGKHIGTDQKRSKSLVHDGYFAPDMGRKLDGQQTRQRGGLNDPRKYVKQTRFHRKPPKPILHAILGQVGNACAFPGCTHRDYLEIAHIRAESAGGPRYDPLAPVGPGTGNIIILCPNHHRLVDAEPHRFSAVILQEMRAAQLDRARQARDVQAGNSPPEQIPARAGDLKSALAIWDSGPESVDENFWQRLFQEIPELLAAAMPGDTVQLGSKCYVGGKNVFNGEGNVADFLYANRSTANVTLVEIKRPDVKLLGYLYRGIFTPSGELLGSVMQAADYRDQLLKNFYAIAHASSVSFEVFNPRALVVIGNLTAENMNAAQRRSFDLFRYGLRDTVIVTFDELFRKVRDLVDSIASHP